MLYRSSNIFQQGTFFTSDLYKYTSGFNQKNNTCWDYELYIDILATGATHEVVDDSFAVFRIHKNSITGSGRLNKEYKLDLDRIFRKYKERYFNKIDYFKYLSFKLINKFKKTINNE